MNGEASKVNDRSLKTVHEARNAAFLSRPVMAWFVAMGLGGLFLALVGATDSYSLSIVLRLTLWGALCLVAAFIGLALEAALLRFGPMWHKAWIWWVALTCGLALAMTPIIFLTNSLTGPSDIAMVPMYFSNSVFISGALVAVRLTIGMLLSDADTDEASSLDTARLLERLPIGMRQADLWAIGSEGHYSRICTDAGDELVLIRLKDAIVEANPVEGLQVHRSWWVAKAAIGELRTGNSKTILVLKNGLEVPVSRSRRNDLRSAGWG